MKTVPPLNSEILLSSVPFLSSYHVARASSGENTSRGMSVRSVSSGGIEDEFWVTATFRSGGEDEVGEEEKGQFFGLRGRGTVEI